MREKKTDQTRKLVVGVTVGVSAFSLLRGQLEWFQQNQWDVFLVSNPDDLAIRAADREKVSLVGIPMSRGLKPLGDLVSLARWVQFLGGSRPDAVNIGTPKASLLGVGAAWLTRVPRRLYVVRGLRLEGTSGPLSWILWCMERVTMQLATDVLFVSRSLAVEARRRRLFMKKKSWIVGAGSSNGVDAEAIHNRVASIDRQSLREELGFSSEDFVAGFVGRISRDKGVDTLTRALRNPRLEKNIRGLLIGAVEESSLVEDIDSLDDRCVRAPWTDDVWGLLPAMDVLVLPTLREGFPNVVLEAAAAGIPAITTNATGAVDSVVPGITGYLIDIGDDSALVCQLNGMNSDRKTLREMAEAARMRATNDFNQENLWEGLAEIVSGVPDPKRAMRIAREDMIDWTKY